MARRTGTCTRPPGGGLALSRRAVLASAPALLALRPGRRPAPGIQITSLPPYGVDGFLAGTASGVDFATHRVAAFVYIDGFGWCTKPTFAAPTVPIQPDGSFLVDVATCPAPCLDNRATIFCVALVATAGVPTVCGGVRIPATLAPLALDCRERHGRTLSFAGRSWGVKESPLPVGPGQNLFSDRPGDVFVDAGGRLHLALAFHDGAWWSSEVVLETELGHGLYTLWTESRLDALDPGATFGAFLWDPFGDGTPSPNREIDLEDSRWGDPGDPTSSQFVVQPFGQPGNLERYALPVLRADAQLTRLIDWSRHELRFSALRGHHDPFDFPPSALLHEWVYRADPAQGRFVPDEGRAVLHLNLWLNAVELGGAPPPRPAWLAGPGERRRFPPGPPLEVIVSDFRHFPPRLRRRP